MSGSSPKPPRPLPPPNGIDRGVRFDTKPKASGGMKYHPATVEDAPEAGPSRHPPNGFPASSPFVNKGKGKAKEDPIEKPRDVQPSSFPNVGPPPNNHMAGAPWLVAANPSQSLGWPGACHPYGGLPAGAGLWAPGVTDNSLACHLYAPPPHLVNNVAYPAFTHQHNPFGPQPTFGAMPMGQPGYVVAQQPAIVPQPMVGQPAMMMPQPFPGAPPMAVGHGGMPVMSGNSGVPVVPGNGGPPPDISGLGKTQGEETVRQIEFAHANKLFEPQDFKPADDDPSRYYYVREVDGNWTQRNRFTIDHMGDCRWYVTDEGWFYAVRLPD